MESISLPTSTVAVNQLVREDNSTLLASLFEEPSRGSGGERR